MLKLTGQSKVRPGDKAGRAGDRSTGDTPAKKGNRKIRAAFFDVDGTLIRKDSQALEAEHILRQGNLSLSYLWQILVTLAALQLHRMGWISLIRQNKVYLKTYKGRTRQWLENQAEDLFCREIEKQFIPQSLALMDQHRRRGDLIVIVSATTEHILNPLEHRLKPDRIFCTRLEFGPDKGCTGKVLGKICGQEEKQAIVQNFAREMNIDLKASHAYSDHHSDIPFLDAVGHPWAVNPTRKLAAHAKNMGWPVHRFE